MARMLHTAYGIGEVIAEDTERGRKSYLVRGAGWEVWFPETQVRTADAPVNTDNSVALPYDPTPQHPAYPATDSTIVPGEMTIDADERTSPADSLTFDSAETSEAGPYPGPAPHLFARRTAGELVMPWTAEDWEIAEQNRLPEDDYAGHPDSLPYPPTEQDYADWEARRNGVPVSAIDPMSLMASRPAGLSDKYADVHGYVDPMSIAAQLRDDPIGFMERKAAQWAQEGMDPRIAELMDLEASDALVRTAAWKDVRKKALRLRKEGKVTVHESNPEAIYASVVGDHDTYETIVVRGRVYDTGGDSVGSWACSCPWGRWAFKRKVSYVGRFCSHGLATYMELRAGKPKKVPRTQPYTKAGSVHEAMPYTEDGYVEGDGWIPGEDFDPYDQDEMEIMRAVWAQEKADRHQHNPEGRGYGGGRSDEYADSSGYGMSAGQGYTSSIHEAIPLNLRPRRLTPDFIINDTEEPITEIDSLDVEEDTRETTGPDQIVHFAAQFDDPDASPIDATAEAAGNLDKLRSMSDEGTEGWEGRMDERTDQLRGLVDDLRAQGVDASPLVASMQRRAFNPLDLATMFFDPDTGEVGDPTGASGVVKDELNKRLPGPDKSPAAPEATDPQGGPMPSADPQAASGVPVDPSQIPGVPVLVSSALMRAFLDEPFNGSGANQKEWIGSSDDYVATHMGPMVDVTDLGDEPIIKYTEGREASRRTADCVEDFLGWCEDEGMSPSNVALQEYAANESLLTDELWEIEDHLHGQRNASRSAGYFGDGQENDARDEGYYDDEDTGPDYEAYRQELLKLPEDVRGAWLTRTRASRRHADWAENDAPDWSDAEDEALTTLAALRIAEEGSGDRAPIVLDQPGQSVNLNTGVVTDPGGGERFTDAPQGGSGGGFMDTLKGMGGGLMNNLRDMFGGGEDGGSQEPMNGTGNMFTNNPADGNMFGMGMGRGSARIAAPNMTIPTPETTGEMFSPMVGTNDVPDTGGGTPPAQEAEQPQQEQQGGFADGMKDLAFGDVGKAWDQTKSLFGSNRSAGLPDDFGFNGDARLGSYDRTDDNSDVVREFHAKMGGDLEWLREGTGMARVAGRAYAPVEQDELIREAHPQGARNLDQLDLEGTHYLAGW